MVASFVHIWAGDFQDDLTAASTESSKAIKVRKATHAKLLDAVYGYADGNISEVEYKSVHTSLVSQYREAKRTATQKIAIKNEIAENYKINNFQNLEQFLYGLGQGVTIFFAGLIILLISFRLPIGSRLFSLMASTAILSVGSFWVTWALFQNGDYSKGFYYLIMLFVSCAISVSLWYLLRSIKTTNEKIKSAISFSLRARKSLYAHFEQSPKKAPHQSKESFDEDLFNTLDDLSR